MQTCWWDCSRLSQKQESFPWEIVLQVLHGLYLDMGPGFDITSELVDSDHSDIREKLQQLNRPHQMKIQLLNTNVHQQPLGLGLHCKPLESGHCINGDERTMSPRGLRFHLAW